jgi:hypothetical protein
MAFQIQTSVSFALRESADRDQNMFSGIEAGGDIVLISMDWA